MQLRNRRTKQTWNTSLKGLENNNFFVESKLVPATTQSKLSMASIDNDLLNEFLEDIKTRIPKNYTEIQKKEVIQNIEKMCKTHGEQIIKFSSELKLMMEEESKKANNVKKQDKSSYLPLLDVNLAKAALLPVVGALVSSFPAAAAARVAEMASNYVIHEGVPSGATSLCDSYLLGCIEGYLTVGTAPWDSTMPQFNRVVQQSGSGEAVLANRETLRKCMDIDKLGNTVIQTLTSNANANATQTATTTIANATTPNGICAGQSSVWRNWQLTSQVKNVPSTSCTNFQNIFSAESQGCMSELESVKNTAIIWGSIAGAVVALGCCIYAYYSCKEKLCDNKNTNTNSYSQIV